VATDNEETILEVSGRWSSFFGFQLMAYLRCGAFKGILGGRACRGAEGTGERQQPFSTDGQSSCKGCASASGCMSSTVAIHTEVGLWRGDIGSSPTVASGNGHDHDGCDDEVGVQPATVGGFITGVEDVVQAYSLPRPTHIVFSSPPRSPNSNGSSPLPAMVGLGPSRLPSPWLLTTMAKNVDNRCRRHSLLST